MSEPRRRGRPPLYPWESWFDGDIHVCYMGRDFQTAPSSFRALVHRAANSRGMKAETKIDPEAGSVSFRFFES